MRLSYSTVTEHQGDYLIKKGRLEAEHDNKAGRAMILLVG